MLEARAAPSGARKVRRCTGGSYSHRGAGVPGPPTSSLGGGALFGLEDLPQPEDGQGLYERLCARAACARAAKRSCLCCHDAAPHGEAIGSRLRTFHTVSRETVRKGSRVASGASILGRQSSEIGLFRPGSSAPEASARGRSGLFGQFRSGNPVFERSIERQPVSRHFPRRAATFAEPRSCLARPAPACGCLGVTSGVASVFQGEVGGTCSSCIFQMRNAPLSSASSPRWARSGGRAVPCLI